MARNKVKLEYIEHNSSRRVTYNKRVKGILKKTNELSVLCDVDACTIIYGPYDEVPKVWPSSKLETRRIISDYEKRPKLDQHQLQVDQEAFLKGSMNKTYGKLLKIQRKNRELQMENVATDIMCGKLSLHQVDPLDLEDLIFVIEDRMNIVQHCISVTENGM